MANPWASSLATASRTTVRLTFSTSAISFWDGKQEPGGISPEVIRASNFANKASVREGVFDMDLRFTMSGRRKSQDSGAAICILVSRISTCLYVGLIGRHLVLGRRAQPHEARAGTRPRRPGKMHGYCLMV